MPEGPEIYYLKELLKKKIKGKIFKNIVSNTKSVVDLPEEAKVIDIDCKGKLLWIITEKYYVHLHMMISGWLVFEKPKICKYEFQFENMNIYMDDTRRFSKVSVVETKEEHDEIVEKLGFDFLRNEITQESFGDILENAKKNIGELLLNQKIFCGIGNYIRNEALYLANINPKTKCGDLKKEDIENLYGQIKFVLFSNLFEMLENEKLKIPRNIKRIAPKKLEVPYKYKIYDRKEDDNGNKITKEKLAGRWIYYIKK